MEVMKISAVNSGFRGDCANNFSPKTNPVENFRGETRLSNPTTQNLQAYYLTKQPAFGRLTVEHLEHGAYVDEAKNVIFNLFTFKDVKQVFVELENKATIELKRLEGEVSIFAKKVGPNIAKHGDKYRFKLIHEDGRVAYVKDPYAMRRRSVKIDDFSYIYDHNRFIWSNRDKQWAEGKDCRKISRIGAKKGLRTLKDLIIDETHIGTITKEGTFKAAKAKIDQIVKDGISNTIELLPVENVHSFNWGYDGVDKFAPQETKYGGPDALKALIDYAHKKGLNVIMDLVPNHIGPDGNVLREAGPYINTKANGGFGDKFNLENDSVNNPQVRDYVSNMCLNWIRNYHCDGLRLDLVSDMDSDFALKQLEMEVRYHHPDAFIIAEDGRMNYSNVTQPLTDTEEAIGKTEEEHAAQIKHVDTNSTDLNMGIPARWDFSFLHSLEEALRIDPNENAQAAKGKLEDLANYMKDSGTRVRYLQSHDEVGNEDGIRLITKISRDKMGIFSKVTGKDDCEKGQRAAQAAQSILTSKVCGEYDTFSKAERLEFLQRHYINTDITPQEVEAALKYAVAKHKLALGQVFTTPGAKMLFQGDENASITPFRFFRYFSDSRIRAQDEENLLKSKGYEPGYAAFMDSKLDRIPYAYDYKKIMAKVKAYTKELSVLSREIPALNSGDIGTITTHGGSKIQARHLKKGTSEVFVVSNFDGYSYLDSRHKYGINFPEGKWQEVLNSNNKLYGGDGKGLNKGNITGGGQGIYLPCESVVIFKRIG